MISVEPFDRLRQTIDPEWLAILLDADRHIFPAEWNLAPWAWFALRVGAFLLVAGSVTPYGKRLLRAVLLVAAGGLLAALMAADVLSNVLLTQLQLFRAAWLLMVVGNFCLGLAAYEFYHTRPDANPLLALLTLSYALSFLDITAVPAILVCALAVYVVLREKDWLDHPLARSSIYFAAFTVSLALLAFRLSSTMRAYRELAAAGQTPLWWFFEIHRFDPLAVGLVLIVATKALLDRCSRVAPAISLALLLLAIVNWDHRSPWDRYLERGAGFETLQERIPKGSTVFWDEGGNRTRAGVRTFEGVKGAWLALRRPVYISQALGAGLVFHRETAIAYRDRARKIARVDGREYMNLYGDRKLTNRPLGPITADDVRETCAAAPGLDFLILSREVAMEYSFKWRPAVPTPVAFEEGIEPIAKFVVYDCRKIRQ